MTEIVADSAANDVLGALSSLVERCEVEQLPALLDQLAGVLGRGRAKVRREQRKAQVAAPAVEKPQPAASKEPAAPEPAAARPAGATSAAPQPAAAASEPTTTTPERPPGLAEAASAASSELPVTTAPGPAEAPSSAPVSEETPRGLLVLAGFAVLALLVLVVALVLSSPALAGLAMVAPSRLGRAAIGRPAPGCSPAARGAVTPTTGPRLTGGARQAPPRARSLALAPSPSATAPG